MKPDHAPLRLKLCLTKNQIENTALCLSGHFIIIDKNCDNCAN